MASRTNEGLRTVTRRTEPSKRQIADKMIVLADLLGRCIIGSRDRYDDEGYARADPFESAIMAIRGEVLVPRERDDRLRSIAIDTDDALAVAAIGFLERAGWVKARPDMPVFFSGPRSLAYAATPRGAHCCLEVARSRWLWPHYRRCYRLIERGRAERAIRDMRRRTTPTVRNGNSR